MVAVQVSIQLAPEQRLGNKTILFMFCSFDQVMRYTTESPFLEPRKKAPPSPAEPFRGPRASADDNLGRCAGLPLDGADEMPEPVAVAEAGHEGEDIVLADQSPDEAFRLRPDMGGRLIGSVEQKPAEGRVGARVGLHGPVGRGPGGEGFRVAVADDWKPIAPGYCKGTSCAGAWYRSHPWRMA